MPRFAAAATAIVLAGLAATPIEARPGFGHFGGDGRAFGSSGGFGHGFHGRDRGAHDHFGHDSTGRFRAGRDFSDIRRGRDQGRGRDRFPGGGHRFDAEYGATLD